MVASATARYIEPVSMYSSLNACANMRPSVDLPEPDGPSIAMIIFTQTRRTLRLITKRPCVSVASNRRPAQRVRLYRIDPDRRRARRADRHQTIHDSDADQRPASGAYRE